MPRLENWSTVALDTNPYTAPECIPVAISGEVHGHPKFANGMRVTTSAVKGAEGRMVQTENSEYELGEISPQYRKYLDDMGYEFDPENPIKVKRHGES